MSEPQHKPGATALVGSGEYTDAMNETDRYLIDTLGGAANTRVALLPTASGLESNGPRHWNEMGKHHFTGLGVADIRATDVIDATYARDADQLDLLRDANFFYFSGGNPQHVIESLRGSPAWDIITQANANGAVIAGCSAGAMAMSGYTVAIRFAFTEGPIQSVPSLGVIPQVMVFPHFDRMLGRLGRAAFRTRLLTAPTGVIPVGVDEDTALVRIDPHPAQAADGQGRWRVMGRQTVTIFWPNVNPQILKVGEEVVL